MQKISLFPSGDLNLDADLNTVPKGDYVDARNIIVSTSKSGGSDTIKILESIKSIGLPTLTGTYKASYRSPSGEIYVLYRTSGTVATVYRINKIQTAVETIITYNHTVTVDFTPDIRVVGDSIVWNYYGTGQLVYWLTRRANATNVPYVDMIFVKAPPINNITVVKNTTVNAGLDVLENSDFQFALRYKYDTGEYSVLSPYTETYRGQKDTSSYTITINSTGKPTFATFVEIYVRQGSYGTFRRLATKAIAVGGTIVLTWKGDYYETLPDEDSSISFSAVPYKVGSLEVAVDRLFVGNYEDDFSNDSVGEIVITANTGLTLGGGGTIKNYLNAGTSDASINSKENGTYIKPFANSSQYSVGLLFFDSALKTRGVEFVTNFDTGNFANIIAPSFSLNTGGYTKPSSAVYMQLAITRNLSKGATFEGFASSCYFELEVDEVDPTTSTTKKEKKNKLSVVDSDLPSIKYFIVDISGMRAAGEVYSYQSGDRININVPDGVQATIDVDLGKTGSFRKLDLSIVYAEIDTIYCEWTGGECLNDGIPDTEKFFFEIYSPKREQEDSSVLFYGVGDLINVTGGIPGTISDYHIGDTFFKKISFSKYTKTKYRLGYVRSNPAIRTPNIEVIVKANKTAGIIDILNTSTMPLGGNKIEQEFYLTLNNLVLPSVDLGRFEDGSYIFQGYFDGAMKYALTQKLDFTTTHAIFQGSYLVKTTVYASIERQPFDYATGTFSSAIKLSKEELIYENEISRENVLAAVSVRTINKPDVVLKQSNIIPALYFNTTGKEAISSGDKFSIKIRVVTISSFDFVLNGGIADQYSFVVKNKAAETDTATISIKGTRITPVVSYYNKETVPLALTKTDFAVRTMSGYITNSGWNSSTGKPYLKSNDSFTSRRINAFRHGGNVIPGTEVNNMSQFSILNTYEVPIENGAIMSMQRASRLQGDGDMLLLLCENEVSYALLGESSINQASNYEIRAGVNNIIGSIRNLGERTGIQDKQSVYNHNGDIYWWDNSRSLVCKFNKNGVDIISNKKVKSHFIKQSGVALFAFDPFYNLLHVLIDPLKPALSFDVDTDSWKTFTDVIFNGAIHIGDIALFFNNGVVYRTLETLTGNPVGDYMGVAKDASISMVLNTGIPVNPLSIVIGHSMNVTNYANPNNLLSSFLEINITNENGQETEIVEANLTIEDSKLFSYVLRDINSTKGIVSGDHIRGHSNVFKLTLKDISQINRIFELDINIDPVTGH